MVAMSSLFLISTLNLTSSSDNLAANKFFAQQKTEMSSKTQNVQSEVDEVVGIMQSKKSVFMDCGGGRSTLDCGGGSSTRS